VALRGKIYEASELGAIIRDARKTRGLSQIDLARRANVARDAVQRLEEGRGTVTVTTAIRLLNTLSLDLSVFDRTPTYPGSESAHG
jgi:transcriptional regulator with XRE-family HTH domain